MTVEVFIDVVREGISTLITIIIPPLLVSLAVGLVISIFQAVTQIHEQTLTFAPRIIAIFLTILVIGGWMLQKLLDLALDMLTRYLQMI